MLGKKIYKYYRFDPNNHWTLPLNVGQIYFDSFENFNDPYECAFTFNTNGDFAEKKRQVREWNSSPEYKSEVDKCENDAELAKFVDPMNLDYGRNNIRQSLTNIRVSCFSRSPEILLMWSHYTKSHGGFCLEFDMEQLGNEFRWIEVAYVEQPPSISIFDKTTPESFIGHKFIGWQYEQEVRAISAHEKAYVKPEAITQIYLGCNVLQRSHEARNNLLRLKTYLDISVPHLKTNIKIASLNRQKFQIEFRNYNYASLEVACTEKL